MSKKVVSTVIKEWKKWRNNWDDLCNQCGKCCYKRKKERNGNVVIDYSSPCEYLDKMTNLCIIYENRLEECDHCGKVGLCTALFNRTLPSDCAYVQTFRVWRTKKEE